MSIVKNGLTLTETSSGRILCEELRSLPCRFLEMIDLREVEEAKEERLRKVRDRAELLCSSQEEFNMTSLGERKRLGQEKFDEVVKSIDTSRMSPLQQALFWFGNWWYFHPKCIGEIHIDGKEGVWRDAKMIARFILPILPEAVRGMELAETVTGFGHFALLFINNDQMRRLIVTDTELFEIRGVRGYTYLDITPEGLPITRSVCQREGSRAFFDGHRLMTHSKFRTCAPKTILIDGGYKVNSTMCTIVNGMLFDLMDPDDKIAHTDGSFMGMCGFYQQDHARACEIAEKSGHAMRVHDGKVYFNNVLQKPLGHFEPSQRRLLDNGFTLYDWSEFREVEYLRFEHVLVVDDLDTWISEVKERFGKEVPNLKSYRTTSARKALKKILETRPEAVILDMHLSKDERFEGLWIANQLAANNFEGEILLASRYPEEHLRAMQKLINRPVMIPGKNLDSIRKCLYGKGLSKPRNDDREPGREITHSPEAHAK